MYNYNSIDEMVREAATAPKSIVMQFFKDFIQKLVHQIQIRDDIENIKTELKNEFNIILDNYSQYVLDTYNRNIDIDNEKTQLLSFFKEIIDEYRFEDAQSDREYTAIINTLKFILQN